MGAPAASAITPRQSSRTLERLSGQTVRVQISDAAAVIAERAFPPPVLPLTASRAFVALWALLARAGDVADARTAHKRQSDDA